MGNSSSDLLKKYWNQSKRGLRESKDNREVKRCFDAYDKNRSGWLEYDEATQYIQDVLSVSGLKNRIFDEADTNGIDRTEYYNKFVKNIFDDMDVSKQKKLSFEEILKPKYYLWEDFLRLVSAQCLHELRSSSTPKLDTKPKTGRKKLVESDNVAFDDELDDDIIKGPEKKKAISLESATNTATEAALNDVRDQLVQDVIEVLGIDEPSALALLNHFHWDKKTLVMEFIEDPITACKRANIEVPDIKPDMDTSVSDDDDKPSAQTKKEEEKEELECSICYDDTTEWTKLPACGHSFCNACWQTNLEVQIKEGHTLDIKCMHQGCNKLVPNSIVTKLVGPEYRAKYTAFLSKAMVDSSEDIRWCPAPNCGKVIMSPTHEGDNMVGKCICGSFCWKCGEEAHTPVSCDEQKAWKEREGSDTSATKQWLAGHTKKCPKCKNGIEKNDGCFQMRCGKCRHTFCWRCLQPWWTHTSHFKCPWYRDSTPDNEVDGVGGGHVSLKQSEKKYLFWLDQYNSWKKKYCVPLDGVLAKYIDHPDDAVVGHRIDMVTNAWIVLSTLLRILKWTAVKIYITRHKVQQRLLTVSLADMTRIEGELEKLMYSGHFDELMVSAKKGELYLKNFLSMDESF